MGDQVLSGFTRIVAGAIRTEDVLARYGGEEFAIIAQGTGLEGGRTLGERIRESIARQPIPIQGDATTEVPITVSAGIAALRPGSEVDVAGMLATADRNLYSAKHEGRDRVIASEVE